MSLTLSCFVLTSTAQLQLPKDKNKREKEKVKEQEKGSGKEARRLLSQLSFFFTLVYCSDISIFVTLS